MASFFLLLLSLLLIISDLPPTKAQDKPSTDPSYYYNLCSSYKCHNRPVPYPFAVPALCHHPSFNTSCPAGAAGYVLIESPRQTGALRVFGDLVGDSLGTSIYIAADSLFSCGQISSPSYTDDPSIFNLPRSYTYGTHLNCSKRPSSLAGLQPASCLRCANGTDRSNVCYYSPGFVVYPDCENFFVYVPVGFNVSAVRDLRGYLQKGFVVNYNKAAVCRGCEGSGGRCGASPAGDFVCFCKDSVHRNNCSDGLVEDLKAWFPGQEESGSLPTSVVLAIALSTSGFVLLLLVLATVLFIFALRKKRRSTQFNENTTESGLEVLVDGLSPTRYSYSQIRKFTNNFSLKLGEGGFGNVYKGVIHKNRHETLVAVKILKLLKQSEKQFMNEVATIGRIHHNNLVKLLGYCVEGKKRGLVYEYMENGSLDRYINTSRKGDGSSNFECHLTTKQRHAIALETAKGIQYLHEGCRSRILHCDIKPHNVLLDSNLSAKVSDFGLAKMIDKDCSHISLTAAQGTPGYAAPEMWSKAYGPVTEKSDVYSYGMLVLEMAGGRIQSEPNPTTASPHKQFVCLPSGLVNHVKKKLEISSDLGYFDDKMHGEEESDEDIIERMCLVGLWCIQHIPSNRPSMSRVIQMLNGSVEIEIPPNPFPCDGGDEEPRYLATSTVCLSIVAAEG